MGLWYRHRFNNETVCRSVCAASITEMVAELDSWQVQCECLLDNNLITVSHFTHSSDPLFQYLNKENIKNAVGNIVTLRPTPIFDDIAIERKKLIACCKELPTEWTVIQLCKRLNPKQIYSTFAESAAENVPLSMTIFCHAGHQLREPINIEIKCDWNFYELAFNVSNTIDEVLCSKSKGVTVTDLCNTMLPVSKWAL